MQDLEALERVNLLRALEASDWRVAGEKGAARLLGMNPSTLNSRMKALGIRRARPVLPSTPTSLGIICSLFATALPGVL